MNRILKSVSCLGRRQQGSSALEIILVSMVAVPLFISIVHHAKLAHFRMQLPQTSRYLAWQQALTHQVPTNESLNRQILSRVLSADDQFGVTESQPQVDASPPLWRSRFIDHAIITAETNLVLTRQRSHQSSALRTGVNALTTGINLLSLRNFDLPEAGFAQHNVQVPIDTLHLFEGIDCQSESGAGCLSSRTVLLANDWASFTPEHYAAQINSLKPIAAFTRPTELVAPLLAATRIFQDAQAIAELPSHVDLEALPEDRLGVHQ